jgi:molecular chaperone GrpE (heat shock protein)
MALQGRVIDLITKKDTLVDLTERELSEATARTAEEQARLTEIQTKAAETAKIITDNLPSLQDIQAAIDKAETIEDVKMVLSRLIKVLYLLTQDYMVKI